LYRNVELTRAAEYVNEFLAKESETSNHPFYELIHDYQRSRLALLANEKSFQKLKVSAEEEKLKVWTLHDKQVVIYSFLYI
jgi:wyosine [tRNA(Phe)-imidazoG37] synthetase (radical SAM superfamily)